MRKDIDKLMKDNSLDAILVTGPARHNPSMYYFTGKGHISHAELIKIQGKQGVLYYNPMEREEAAKTGLVTKSLADFNFMKLLKEANGNNIKARAHRYQEMLSDLGLQKGRMAIYGQMDSGEAYGVYSELSELMPDLKIVTDMTESVLLNARNTKDTDEIERIRKMGDITTSVVGDVAGFLTSHRAKEGILVKKDGQPLRIRDVKSKINMWLAERGAENPEGTIFALGRDAGIPHSAGNPDNFLKLGETIVFDIFPCEAGGGYFYDFTRTWCLGYATDDAQELYNDVKDVYQKVMCELEVNGICQSYQDRTCELFEEKGHPTVGSNPKTLDGYVHSLGHGLGLDVHERPWFGKGSSKEDRLEAGVVVTIEPGLYYPDRGMGCRLEDTVWVTNEGKMEVLADYPLDLVLPVKNS